MKTKVHTRRRALLTSAAAPVIALALWAGPAGAQEAARSFAIAPQPLADALLQLSRQADIDIVASASLTRGRTAPQVSGEMPTAQAMTMLLAGSGLQAVPSTSGYVLARASDPQSGSAAGGGAEVEALIVTAQKREEDIQDVPIAISAFSQEDLTRSQIAGGPDLITQVPNMTFTKTNFSSYSIQLRGIGTQAISATTDPAVAVAFNNTPFIRNRFFEQEFYDLQRVEVLRGPQGTLYGRNATAGVVNIISQKPKFVAEAKLSGDISNFSSSRLEGMVNIPLVEDKVALRLAGAWTKREGYSTNELTGNPIDGRDLWSTRLSLRFAPTDRIEANLIWEHFQEDDDRLRSGKQLCKKDVVTDVFGAGSGPNGLGVDVHDIPYLAILPNQGLHNLFSGVQAYLSQGCERVSLYSPEAFQTPNGLMLPFYLPISGVGLPVGPNPDPYLSATQSQDLRMIESTVDPDYRAKSDLAELQVSFDLTDNLTLTSETAFSRDFVWSMQDFNRFNTAPGAWRQPDSSDRPGLLQPGPNGGIFCDPQIGCSDRLVALDLSTAKATQFSQEFRLGSDFDGPFNFSLGANFLRSDSEDKYYVFINSLTMAGSLTNTANLPPYEGGVSDNSQCLPAGPELSDPRLVYSYVCVYADPNPIGSLNDQGHNYFLSKNPYKLISYAAFGEAYYELSDNLKVTGGLRWTVDKKEAPLVPSWALAGLSYGYPVKEVIEQDWSEPTGRLAIDWKPDVAFTDETLLYASYSHGYKAGGANPPPYVAVGSQAQNFGGVAASETRPKTFAAEFVDAFELGAKNTLADGAVTLNLAAFYYDYKDYQISEIVDRAAFNRNFDATVWGLEIEADWRPLENLKFGFKGGYEKTRIADGERAIDLMDRTAGRTDWLVVRPFPTFVSSCILPTWLFAHAGPPAGGPAGLYGLGAGGGAAISGCEIAYFSGYDPVTNAPYVDLTNHVGPVVTGTINTLDYFPPGEYPGWNPLDESQGHNHGEGFFKDLGGNELPNAPQFTATVTADYTLPLPNEWLATLHTDLHWQSESWWRVFNDHEFNRLDEYFTMNLAAIFTNEEAGWNIMAYIKNVTDETAVTGAFLNSDDTALTTNVFLTEPRLYGLRVTKNWSGGSLLGSFGGRHEGPYPLTLELGGQAQQHDAPYETIRPGFAPAFADLDVFAEGQNNDLDWGDGRNARLTYRPGKGPWSVSAAVRFGKTNGTSPNARAEESTGEICGLTGTPYEYICDPSYPEQGRLPFIKSRTDWLNVSSRNHEEFKLIDFAVGRDVDLGALGQSTLTAGLRYAQFESQTGLGAEGVPDWDLPPGWFFTYVTHSHYEATLVADREFEGWGPAVSWDASHRLLGDEEVGRVTVDWSLGGSVLFGKQRTSITGTEELISYNTYGAELIADVWAPPSGPPATTPVNISRAESATVPSLDLSLGLSYKIDRMSIGAGYRWERYFDVLDAGDDAAQQYDRTIDGPYFKIAVGFGG